MLLNNFDNCCWTRWIIVEACKIVLDSRISNSFYIIRDYLHILFVWNILTIPIFSVFLILGDSKVHSMSSSLLILVKQSVSRQNISTNMRCDYFFYILISMVEMRVCFFSLLLIIFIEQFDAVAVDGWNGQLNLMHFLSAFIPMQRVDHLRAI